MARGLPIGGLIDFELGDERINGLVASVDVDLRLPIIGTLEFAVKLIVGKTFGGCAEWACDSYASLVTQIASQPK